MLCVTISLESISFISLLCVISYYFLSRHRKAHLSRKSIECNHRDEFGIAWKVLYRYLVRVFFFPPIAIVVVIRGSLSMGTSECVSLYYEHYERLRMCEGEEFRIRKVFFLRVLIFEHENSLRQINFLTFHISQRAKGNEKLLNNIFLFLRCSILLGM